MDTALGLLAFAGYIVGVIALAAAITYVVIKIFPTEREPKKDDDTDAKPSAEQPTTPSDTPAGSLFRRSKRARG